MHFPSAVLSALLVQRAGRRGVQSHVLSMVAAAAAACLLLVLSALWLAAGSRAERTTWLTPQPNPAGNIVQVRSVTTVRGESVVVIDLARVHESRPVPTPPGLRAFPKPGDVFVSPALNRLIAKTPGEKGLLIRESATGLGASISGQIGVSGLASPDQLLAVVGHLPTDPLIIGARGPGGEQSLNGTAGATVSGFAGSRADAFTDGDGSAVILAVGLLVVPIVALAVAAGRLGAVRREQRLAGLRLAGGTPRQILAMACHESLGVGGIGAVGGAALYAVTLPLLARFPLGIGGWYVHDLWVGIPVLFAVIAAVAVMTAVSAVSLLARVIRDPLGVARRDQAARTRAIRIVAALALIGYIAFTARGGGLKAPQIAALATLLYGAFWLAGPWVIARLGALTSRLARRPATLIAGRRLLDDPHGAWRAVSGLVLAGMVAGFVSIAQLNLSLQVPRDEVVVPIGAAGLTPQTAADDVRGILRRAGFDGVTARPASPDDILAAGSSAVVATVNGGPQRAAEAATVLTGLDAGSRPFTAADAFASDRIVFDGYATAALASLVIGFVIAMIATALTSIADVLDRRDTYRLLRRAGAPMRVITRARALEVALPLIVLAGGTTACGIYVAQRVNATTGSTIDTSRIVNLVLCVLIGVTAITASLASGRGLLRRVTQEGAEQQQ